MSSCRRRACVALVTALAAASLAACTDAAGAAPSAPVEDVAGVWGMQDTEGVVSLELKDDGTITGTDGCNRLTGSWDQDGDQVAFGPWSTTRMACQSVDTWIAESVKATVQGENLIFADEFGIEIGTLQPNS